MASFSNNSDDRGPWKDILALQNEIRLTVFISDLKALQVDRAKKQAIEAGWDNDFQRVGEQWYGFPPAAVMPTPLPIPFVG